VHYPTIQSLLASDEKSDLLLVKRSGLSLINLFFWAAVTALATYFLILELEQPILRWLNLIPIFILLEAVRELNDDLYSLGLHKITHYRGRISFSYSVPSVKYAHIRSITVNQSIWGRILGFGDILIQTAAQDKNEISISGVRDPVGLASLLEELRNNSRKLQETGGDEAEYDHSRRDSDE